MKVTNPYFEIKEYSALYPFIFTVAFREKRCVNRHRFLFSCFRIFFDSLIAINFGEESSVTFQFSSHQTDLLGNIIEKYEARTFS